MDTAERAVDGSAAGGWIQLGAAPRHHPEVVGDLVPAGYAAYARIFHPLWIPGIGRSSWGSEATRRGFELTRLTQLPEVLDASDVDGRFRWLGNGSHHLPRFEWHELGPVLRRHSAAPSFFVGSWEGSAYPPEAEGHGLLELPNRRYFVVEIPMARWHDSGTVVDCIPNLVWSSDRSWIFNSDIDCSSTYLAGSRELIDDLLASPELEVMEAEPDDPVYLS